MPEEVVEKKSQLTGSAEVGNLDVGNLLLCVLHHQQVFRLQIPVNDVLGVAVAESLQYLLAEEGGLDFRALSVLHNVIEELTWKQNHYQFRRVFKKNVN